LVQAGTAILIFFVISQVYCEPHNRGRRGLGLLLQIGIMILPLLYLPTAAVSNLSPEAAKKRSFLMAQPQKQKDKTSRQPKSDSVSGDTSESESDYNLPENPSLLRLALDATPYTGRRVTTTGMVYVGDKLPENAFLCYRLLMFCCAADAKAVGVVVEYDKSRNLTKGDWVQVEGTVGFTTLGGQRLTRISAEKVTPTSPPKDPYLFP